VQQRPHAMQRSHDWPSDSREIMRLQSVFGQRTLALSAGSDEGAELSSGGSPRWKQQVQKGLMKYLEMLLALQFLCVFASQPSWL